MLSGVATIRDEALYPLMKALYETENVFVEPSSCAAFAALRKGKELTEYCRRHGLEPFMSDAAHIAWATGGSMVPPEIQEEYLRRG